MTETPPTCPLPSPKGDDIMPGFETESVAEIAQLKTELELVKSANPFRMAETAIELQIERLRVAEITKARDIALQRLAECYVSIRRKNELIERMRPEHGQEDKGDVNFPLQFSGHLESAVTEQLKAHITMLEASNKELRQLVAQLQASATLDLPPLYEADVRKVTVDAEVQTDSDHFTRMNQEDGNLEDDDETKYVHPNTDDPQELVNARYAILASMPLPHNSPDATLNAIVIPPPFTIHEFLSGASVNLKTALANYKILHNATTKWCPEREEHGYIYTPVFKCNTNPRIATAHCWSATDVIGKMNMPTECFYNKEGVWYYAGSYTAFRMDELLASEWAQLPQETTSAIVKETLAGRKNISPQNTFETTQLYAAGALKVMCVGLRCVGFNQEVYKSVQEHFVKFGESRWKSLAMGSPSNINSNIPLVTMTPELGTRTPVVSKHLPRTPGLISSSTSLTNGSPPARGIHLYKHTHVNTSPALGLGLGSLSWGMSANNKGGVSSTLPLPIPTQLPPSTEHEQQAANL